MSQQTEKGAREENVGIPVAGPPQTPDSDASKSHELLEEAKPAPVSGGGIALFFGLLIGFSGVIGISLFTHWYEVVITQSSYSPSVAVSVPPIVFFLLFFVLLLVNPLIGKLFPNLILRKRELLIILSLWLITSAVCFVGMVQPVVQLIGTALNKDTAGATTKRIEFEKYLDPSLFLSAEDSGPFHYGLRDNLHRLPLRDIPWGKWLRPLAFWFPFSLLTVIFVASLVRIMHRQWSRHELLTYPLADISGSLLEYHEGGSLPAIFYKRSFLMGIGLVAFIYLVNGLSSYFPLMVNIPMNFQHTSIIKSFPFIQKYCGREGYSLFRGMLYPLVVAIAVLLPTEVSFSCWMGWVVMVLGTGCYFLVAGEVIGSTETGFLVTGMYVAMCCVILFIGRKEYWAILKNAFVPRKSDDPAFRAAVIACRIFLVCFVVMVGVLCWAGMDGFSSFLYVASFALVIILIARFTAETGIPWLNCFAGKTTYFPFMFLGSAAMGPQTIAILATIGAVFTIGGFTMTNTVAAQETTIEKIAEKTLVPSFRKWMTIILLLGVILAMACGFGITLSDSYSYGPNNSRFGWTNEIEAASKKIAGLEIEKLLDATEGKGPIERFSLVQSPPNFWRFFIFGCAIIGTCMFMRLRFTWWPFHPLPFLLLNEWCLSRLYTSFLVGWLIKIAILRIGGGKVFSSIKPFFIGVVFGQCIISGVWIVVNVAYYLATDNKPPPIVIFP